MRADFCFIVIIFLTNFLDILLIDCTAVQPPLPKDNLNISSNTNSRQLNSTRQDDQLDFMVDRKVCARGPRSWRKQIGVKYVPGMRYCMFIASSRILSPLKQIAAALNKIALTNDQPTPTQATTYDQSYEISELSFRTWDVHRSRRAVPRKTKKTRHGGS